MHDSAQHWNELHANPRFLPVYPSEHVVRFLVATQAYSNSEVPVRFLDIGAGGGRHMRLAAELGFRVFGTDISITGLTHTRQRLMIAKAPYGLAVARMTNLPFANNYFHAIVSYGVFYYGTRDEMQLAIAEARRVLAPRSRCFIVLRSTQDYRFGKGRELEPQTFHLNISDTNELGTIQHFVTAENIRDYFSAFSRVTFEKTETTFSGRTRLNSDWLITAEK